jgi:hypothetical protein
MLWEPWVCVAETTTQAFRRFKCACSPAQDSHRYKVAAIREKQATPKAIESSQKASSSSLPGSHVAIAERHVAERIRREVTPHSALAATGFAKVCAAISSCHNHGKRTGAFATTVVRQFITM